MNFFRWLVKVIFGELAPSLPKVHSAITASPLRLTETDLEVPEQLTAQGYGQMKRIENIYVSIIYATSSARSRKKEYCSIRLKSGTKILLIKLADGEVVQIQSGGFDTLRHSLDQEIVSDIMLHVRRACM